MKKNGLEKTAFAAAVTLALAITTSTVQAANSDLDLSFGGGVVKRAVTTSISDLAYASALQPDGKILVGGYSTVNSNNREFAMIRHKIDGTPDTTFGDGTGKVITPMTSSLDAILGAVALPQGGMLTVGYAYSNSYPSFGLAKYTSAGVLDTSFGAGTGKVISNFSIYGAIARAVALQPDGKYVVAGEAYDPFNITKNDFFVARYNSDGSPDGSFGPGGSRRIQMSSNANDAAFGVAIQPDGKIVVTGDYSTGTALGIGVARLNADGTMDATFGASGKVLFARGGLNSFGRAVAVQPDGKIVVLGNGTITFNNTSLIQVLRFNTDGSLDTGFNGGGYATNGFGAGLVLNFAAVELLPTGQILVAGRGFISTQNQSLFLTARYTAAGLLDTTYNSGAGFKLGDLGSVGYSTSAQGIALAADGRFTVTGSSGGYYGMVKYLGDALDTTPDAASFTSVSGVAPSTLQISNVVTISGLTPGALVPMTVSNGKYSINGNPAASNMAYVKNGDMIMVSHVAAATSAASTSTILNIGGVHAANNRALVIGSPITLTFTSTTL